MNEHQAQAAELARRISLHHQGCRDCQRGGLLRLGPGGVRRHQCETERALLAELEREQAAGWPEVMGE